MKKSREYIGIFERLTVKSPWAPFRTCVTLFIVLWLLLAFTTLIAGEFDKFLVDLPVFSALLCLTLLIYVESRQGILLRKAVEGIRNAFKMSSDYGNDYLDAVFNIPQRIAGGITAAILIILAFFSFGFWYDSLLLVAVASVLVCILGFSLGQLFVTACYHIYMTRILVRGVSGKLDILDHQQRKILEHHGSLSLQTSVIGSMAGFFGSLGVLTGPWRTAPPILEMVLLLIAALFSLCIAVFLVPIKSIHETFESAIERAEQELSVKTVDALSKLDSAIVTGFSDDNPYDKLAVALQGIQIADNRVKSYPRWPLNLPQVASVLGSLGLVILESVLVLLFSGNIF
jgi:hypothetical protein